MNAIILKNKLLRNFNDYGLWVCLKKTIFYFLKPFYQNIISIVYKVDLEKIKLTIVNKSDFSYRLVNPEDTNLINQIKKMEEWLQGNIEDKLLANGICMAVLGKDKVVGFYLAALGEVFLPLLKLQVILRPYEAWGEQITIKKKYRRKGLATELKNRIYIVLKERGIKTIYGHAAIFNNASLKSAEKFNSKQLVKMQHLKIFHSKRLRYVKLASNSQAEESESSHQNILRKYKKGFYYLQPSGEKGCIFRLMTAWL